MGSVPDSVVRMNSDFVFASRDEAASHYWHLPEVTRPAHANTQWLAFRFRLDGMAAHSPASHFAVVLRARLGFDASLRPATISGRGLTLGDTSLAQPAPGNRYAMQPGFGGARGAQIESFWPGGNFLYRDSGVFAQGLRDHVWYRVQLHVNDARWIAVDIASEDDLPQRACVQDRAEHPVAVGATGALIALGRGPRDSGEWSAQFRDIACGWF